ncbi:diacylglycerol kinase [Azomonas agilis]|uniref:Diacylglycerol kinase n=1 Tax=Azomonas agilis TaxID=116849 RepID=A0A562J2F0_9GAMM|nr:diacylglycerol kinase [Azomonas agilis]TWH77461.1 diacylglycerol kinase [Azomonas agilis]
MSSVPSDPIPDAQALKGRSGVARIIKAAGYSLAGFQAAFRGEAAFRQLVLLNLLLLPIAFWVEVSRGERALLVAVLLLSLIVELLNSAIEATVDRISLELHPLSKQAKDMGSAAQFVSLTAITLVWGIILL